MTSPSIGERGTRSELSVRAITPGPSIGRAILSARSDLFRQVGETLTVLGESEIELLEQLNVVIAQFGEADVESGKLLARFDL